MKPKALDKAMAGIWGYLPPVTTVHFGAYLQAGGVMKYATVRGVA